MNYLLFEVWAEEDDGHLELIETTASQREAFEIAEQCLGEGYLAVEVLQETEEGDSELVKRFEGG
jgi:hypothetical protein